MKLEVDSIGPSQGEFFFDRFRFSTESIDSLYILPPQHLSKSSPLKNDTKRGKTSCNPMIGSPRLDQYEKAHQYDAEFDAPGLVNFPSEFLGRRLVDPTSCNSHQCVVVATLVIDLASALQSSNNCGVDLVLREMEESFLDIPIVLTKHLNESFLFSFPSLLIFVVCVCVFSPVFLFFNGGNRGVNMCSCNLSSS